ncbi:MAG TPA: hypothetical protein VIG33_14755 [Pseudobdellovibrionaceae bacterium]|jgi:hypothetical protein
MALYNDKGTDELTGKLEGFIQFFREKTGKDIDREYLKKVLSEIYDQKRRQLINQSFGTETPATLRLLIDAFDDLLPVVQEQILAIAEEPSEEVLQLPDLLPEEEVIKPRKRKPKNG